MSWLHKFIFSEYRRKEKEGRNSEKAFIQGSQKPAN